MSHWDEVCFLCGVSPNGPSELADFTELDEAAESLTDGLLNHSPDILSAIPTGKTQDGLQAYLREVLKKISEDLEDFDDFKDLSDAFRDCIAIGYFDDDGGTPRKAVDEPRIKYLFPDGQFVKKRWVGEADYGESMIVYSNIPSDSGGLGEFWNKAEELTRTSSTLQGSFGNFLSECCFGILEGWIERVALPPMWDGRQLSFI